jgi:tetratricopeptide (TPR) repeat protein
MDNPERPGPGAADDLEIVSRSIVDQTIEELSHARLSEPTQVLALTVLGGLKSRGNYDDLITHVDRLTDEIGQISAILQRCTTALLKAEKETALRRPGSDVWWNTHIRPVARALSLEQYDKGLRLLSAAWVEGLAMHDWANCRKILALRGFPAEMESTLGQMHVVTDKLAVETYAAALDPLDNLLNAKGPNAHKIDQGAAVRLGVLRTRILNREFSDRDMIRQSAREALARAGNSDWRSLALAGLAEIQLAAGEVGAARDTLAKATGTEPPPTDILVASGLLLERDGLWALADQAYDRAVQGDSAAIQAALLRPVPPRLLVRAAISSAVDVPGSIDLLDHALTEGVVGKGAHPERDVNVARAEQLIKLADDDDKRGLATEAREHRRKAAASLVEAGDRYSSSELLPQAVELFQRACRLAPDVAEFHWSYAEGLRLDASNADGTVDFQMLEQARDQMRHGLGLRPPNDTEAWVLASHALIADELSDSDHNPALLVERALLKNPSYTLGYGFLAGILRRQGFVQEAFAVSSKGRETAGTSDPNLFREHLNLMLDRGEYDEALGLIRDQSFRQPDDAELAWAQADVWLRMQRPRKALSALSGQEQTDWARLLRGHCLFAAGYVKASRAEFSSLWHDTQSGPAGHIAGWAAFRAGALDEAIERYQDLRARAPANRSYTRDLGQMLLVRGEVAEGTTLLKEGIAACPYVADLRQLGPDEFAFVRYATADTRHGAEVAHALADLGQRIDRRCNELLDSRRPAESVAALLGSARVAMHAGRPLEALAIYENLVGCEDVPEAREAAMRAGWSANEAAVALFAKNDHDTARSHWSTAARAIARISTEADPDLPNSLICRRMLADLADGSQDELAAWLAKIPGDSGLENAMKDAARALAYDASHLWVLRDGLLALRERADLGADGRRLVVTAANHLPLSQAYHLDAAAAQRPTFLFVNPLELRLGPAAEKLRRSSKLKAATSELQERIEDEMGVRIPWVYAVATRRLADRQVDVRLSARRIGSIVLSGAPESWVRQVMKELEDRVRASLFRLVGVDDVALWLEGWDVSNRDAPTWEPTDPRADRLRLARVLRMLLREHVSVGNRETIVGAVRSQVDVAQRSESATLDTLLSVRKRLGSAALGVGDDTVVVPLPPELEERVAAGLPPDRPVWELPRDQAHQLVADLRAWLRAQPVSPGAISVADGRVRPFVWRLLAAERPAVRVLSQEEFS